MTDIEIVVFNDKSWVRFTEYQKVKEENEQLKQQVLYLEDNLRVVRKDREDLKDDIANGLKEFLKENPATSLDLLANKEVKDENKQLQQQIEKMKCCGNCKHGNEGECDCFENCRSCTVMYCICQKTKKEMDWTDKCDEWELAE